MADDQNSAFVIHQEVFQPHDTGKIQVVGWLVQKDNVRIAEQCLRQKDLHLEAWIHIRHQGVIVLCGDAESLQEPAGIGFRFVSAQFREFLFQFCGAHTVLIGKVFLFVDGILFLAAVIQALVSHDDRIHDRIVIV